MIDEIFADGVMAMHEHGYFDLGADTVDARDQDGIAHLGEAAAKEPSEAANFSKYFGAMGSFKKGGEARFDLISKVYVDSGTGIGFKAITHEGLIDWKVVLEGRACAKRF